MGELERLGETIEWGDAILRTLRLFGWDAIKTTSFAGADGEGVLVVAEKQGLEIRRTGATLAEAATRVMEEAVRLSPPRGDVQLQLQLR
jgi:hypothetical protein